MNKQNWTLLVMGLALIGGAAFEMNRLKTHQKLGAPGIKTTPIPGSLRLNVYLPERVLDFDSVIIPTDTNVLNGLPQDTSFMQRRYSLAKTDFFLLNVVLMGTDRTSIHKPQFCLRGSGWDLDGGEAMNDVLRVERPYPYNLPVMRLMGSRDMISGEERVRVRGIYVYWFVADQDLTASHETRMWRTATHLLRTGELERWAYVSCFAVCLPGQEEATYERMKKFIVSAVPEFQLAANERVARRETTLAAAP